jgi:hypothetical protein
MMTSVGGPVVKIWDLLGGGRLLHTVANHQKTVTQARGPGCLALSVVLWF